MDDCGPKSLAAVLLAHIAGADQTEKLLEHEWSLGNGQCPVCYGLDPDPKHRWGSSAPPGHEEGCLFGQAIAVMKRKGVDTLQPPSLDEHLI